MLKVNILFFIFGFLSLQANYCIQVMSAAKGSENLIVKEASSPQFTLFNDVRVEERGNFYVFRIGDYRQYKEAKNDLRRVKKISKEAFVRKCDFLVDRAIYIKNATAENKKELVTIREKKVIPSTVKQNRYVMPKKDPKKFNSRIKDNTFGIDEDLLP